MFRPPVAVPRGVVPVGSRWFSDNLFESIGDVRLVAVWGSDWDTFDCVLRFGFWNRGKSTSVDVRAWYGFTVPDGWYISLPGGAGLIELVGSDRARLEVATTAVEDIGQVCRWRGNINWGDGPRVADFFGWSSQTGVRLI